jgi:pimeloyl-ACP methyl ester carboxylesterase
MTIRRAYADLPHGQVHYAECGAANASAVLLLHQTPRSWAEYRAVLPLLGERYRAIAMDTVGFGESDALPGSLSIEAWAAAAVQLLDALRIARCHVVGHHTGGVIAAELAARHGARVATIVLSSTPFIDDAFRRARAQRPPIDAVEPSDDGAHLTALWRQRQAWYPPGRPDLLHAFVLDALKVHDVEAGHRAVAVYRMEDRVALIRQPTLLIRAPDDPFASGHAAQWLTHLPQAQVVDIEGGMVPLPDQLPRAFAQVVQRFLDAHR